MSTLWRTYLPYLISFGIGYLLIFLLSDRRRRIPFSIHAFLSLGLGLGISACLTFSSFLIFNQLNTPFVIVINILVLSVLLGLSIFISLKNHIPLVAYKEFHWRKALPFLVIALFAIPFWRHSHFYAFGGWDAWSTWNLKARFLFLGGENWQGLFDPILWRSSPHYPLLLPLINVWGWSFFEQPDYHVPVFTSFVFAFLSVGLLFASLKKFTGTLWSLLCSLVLLTLPYVVKIALSQYCDSLVGFLLFTSLLCLISAKKENNRGYILLAGLFVGFLSFAKNESLVAAVILCGLCIPYFLWKNRNEGKKKTLTLFFVTAFIAFLPTITFYVFYAPRSLTVINGLVSKTDPVTWYRFKVILSFYLTELSHWNWNGLWIVLILGVLFSFKRSVNKTLVIIPAFLLLYWLVISCYYFINTYFQIEWWMQVSLHRIAFSTLPVLFFWSFSVVWWKQEQE